MRTTGTVKRWDSARGFGFIRPVDQTADVFFHIRDMRRGAAFQPREGQTVAYDVIHVGGKGPRAVAVHLPSAAAAPRRSGPANRTPARRGASGVEALVLLVMSTAYAVAVGWSVWSRALPWWVLPLLFGINLLTFFAYWKDKFAAEQRLWRTSEQALHFWSLVGGWPAAWVAQQVLRHKSSKHEFRMGYWFTAIVHVGVVGWFVWEQAVSSG